MCWSGEASTVLAATGIAGAAYSALKRNPEPMALWVCLLYFASMESLQAVSYSVLGQCDSPLNQMMTLFGYLHITFQPFFINSVALYFMPKDAARRIAPWVYFACFCCAITMLVQLYPFNWAGHCTIGRPLCGDVLCTVRGEWHLAWHLPANGIGNSMADNAWLGRGFIAYPLTAFLMPALIGSWRFTLFSYLAGPWLAAQTTGDITEWPAVWCLFSIGLVLAIIKTPLRHHLHVSDPWWVMLGRRKSERRAAGAPALEPACAPEPEIVPDAPPAE
ncbi:MAG TPA: DUF5765 domain-containing protein [Methylocystis sp.]|nr:DUF5765 domain-containing protein [Methylocystis sp.]